MGGQSEPTTASAGQQLSPDGYWWWNGTQWVPVAQPAQPAQPQPQAAPPGIAARAQPLPWLRITAGTVALLGALGTVVASILPYGTFPDPSGGPTSSSSIFSGGFAGAAWDIPEPIFAVLAGVGAATLVLIGINRTVQAISAGVLLAAGAQTALMWAAYYGLATTDGSPEAGGIVGVVAALLILAGGVLALTSLVTRRTAPEALAPATPTEPTPQTPTA